MHNPNFQKYIDMYKPIMEAMHALIGEYSEFILHDLSVPESSVTDILNYRTVTKDGRQLKSTTIFIRENGRIVGCLCCNVDLTEYMMAEKLLRQFCQTHSADENNLQREVFAQDISEVVEDIIQVELQKLPKSAPHMTRLEKLSFVDTLEAKGVFDVRGSAETVAQHLGVSVFTIYNYIKEVRSKNKAV